MAYQPNIPSGSVPLNQDYLNVQGNFSSLNTQFNVDHVPLTSTSGTPPNGYHTSIHLVLQTAIVNTVGYGQLYSKTITDVNTDEAIFWNTGTGNRTVQMTIPIVPTWDNPNTRGFSFLPGGFIIQWGRATKSTGQTVTFGQAFPSAVHSVVLTVNTTPANIPTARGYPTAVISGLSSFVVGNNDGNTQSYSFNWIAIGA